MIFQEILFNVLYNSPSKPTNKAQKRSEGGFNILSILKDKTYLWSRNNLYQLLQQVVQKFKLTFKVSLIGIVFKQHYMLSQYFITWLASKIKQDVHGHDNTCSQGNDHETSFYLARGCQVSRPYELVGKVVLTIHMQKIIMLLLLVLIQDTLAQGQMHGNKNGMTYDESSQANMKPSTTTPSTTISSPTRS